MGDRLDRLTVDGEWDSLFSITMPLVYGTQSDTLSKVCASLYNAQYWLYRESLDSVAHYLGIVQRNLDSIDGLGMEGMYYVLYGMYRMKSEWDFPGMVGMLLKSYDVYKELGEVANMAYPLINIVNFCYMRSDVRGLDYAREVYALVRDNSLSPYYQGVASMVMAEMLSLSDSPRDAWPYLKTADSLIRSEEYEPYYKYHRLAEGGYVSVGRRQYGSRFAVYRGVGARGSDRAGGDIPDMPALRSFLRGYRDAWKGSGTVRERACHIRPVCQYGA